jgi:hypothetical protein
VRWFVAFCFFVLVLPAARAQDQERKLVDRLLRPDTELKNSAQNRKFIADRRSINRQATVGRFYVGKKSTPKAFGVVGTRDFSSWEFNARSFRGSKRQANSSSRNQIVNLHTRYATRTTIGLRAAHNANSPSQSFGMAGGTAVNRTFAGKRPFLDRGKSQKALSQQNTPLTIEEVRELLNKNK